MRKEVIGDCQLYLGDCREIMPSLEAVDAVITDPPYHAEFVHLYGDMAKHASALLPEGGHLLALCGHHQIDEVMRLCSAHLRFWWLCGMVHGNSVNRLPGKWVGVRWKPAIWYVKDRRARGDTNCPVDMLEGGGKDKRFHEWGQPTRWFEHWISALTPDRGIVLDPFMGAGTTGAACLKTRRRFIGIELEQDRFDDACRRIEDTARQGELFSFNFAPKTVQLDLLKT